MSRDQGTTTTATTSPSASKEVNSSSNEAKRQMFWPNAPEDLSESDHTHEVQQGRDARGRRLLAHGGIARSSSTTVLMSEGGDLTGHLSNVAIVDSLRLNKGQDLREDLAALAKADRQSPTGHGHGHGSTTTTTAAATTTTTTTGGGGGGGDNANTSAIAQAKKGQRRSFRERKTGGSAHSSTTVAKAKASRSHSHSQSQSQLQSQSHRKGENPGEGILTPSASSSPSTEKKGAPFSGSGSEHGVDHDGDAKTVSTVSFSEPTQPQSLQTEAFKTGRDESKSNASASTTAEDDSLSPIKKPSSASSSLLKHQLSDEEHRKEPVSRDRDNQAEEDGKIQGGRQESRQESKDANTRNRGITESVASDSSMLGTSSQHQGGGRRASRRASSKSPSSSHHSSIGAMKSEHLFAGLDLRESDEVVLVVNPLVNMQSGLSRYTGKLLGKADQNQPEVLFATLPYLITYLTAPHDAKSSNTLMEAMSNMLSNTEGTTSQSGNVEFGQDAIESRIPDWVRDVWSAFWFCYSDFASTSEVIDELIRRFENPHGYLLRQLGDTFTRISQESDEGMIAVIHRELATDTSGKGGEHDDDGQSKKNRRRTRTSRKFRSGANPLASTPETTSTHTATSAPATSVVTSHVDRKGSATPYAKLEEQSQADRPPRQNEAHASQHQSSPMHRNPQPNIAVLNWMHIDDAPQARASNLSFQAAMTDGVSSSSSGGGGGGGGATGGRSSVSSAQQLARQLRANRIRFNVLMFLDYWFSFGRGAIEICSSPVALGTLVEFLQQVSGNVGSHSDELIQYASHLMKELSKLREKCGQDERKLEAAIGYDNTGTRMRYFMSYDELNIHLLSLCYVQRSLPRWFTRTVKLMQFKPVEIAQELTLMLYDKCYRHLRPEMLISKHGQEHSVHVRNMIRYFKVVSYWPLTTILAEHLDPSSRVKLLMFFVEVAEECRKLNNFHFLFGIVSGLVQPFISWIWELADTKELKRFENLKRVVSPQNDYRIYKADLSKCENKSHIPFLGLSNKMLLPLEERLPPCNPAFPHMANVKRCLSRQMVVQEFLRGQDNPYIAKGGEVYYYYAGPAGASSFPLSAFADAGGIVPSSLWGLPVNGNGPQKNVSTTRTSHVGTPSSSVQSRKSKAEKQSPSSSAFAFDKDALLELPNSAFAPKVKNAWSKNRPQGCISLNHNEDLALLLAYRMSQSFTEDSLKQLSTKAKEESDQYVVNTLEQAGFL